MTGWYAAMEEYAAQGTISVCPFCKGKNVTGKIFRNEDRDSVFVKCDDCKRASHIDGTIGYRLRDPASNSNFELIKL